MSVKPRRVKRIAGIGKLYDWRGTGLLPANGGIIRPLIGIEHIPVVPNRAGIADFFQLAAVLRARGLGLQTATDSDGNIAIFQSLNRLCYQARGSNSISYGTEHMHMTTSEKWTRKQLCASAWIWVHAKREHGIPIRIARLGRTHRGGLTPVIKRGHVSHQAQAVAAGYSDRSDPGPGYDWKFVKHAAHYYERRGTFVGV